MPLPIENYALIGDLQTAALVGADGSIDWLCLPRFDSAACFAALLGTPENGRWIVAPSEPAKVTRRYRPDTLTLETEFTTGEGTVVLVDFMPLSQHNSTIARIVKGTSGRVQMRMELVIRFDYGRSVPWVSRAKDDSLVAVAGPHLLVLRTAAQTRGEDLKTVSDFTIAKGETMGFELTYGPSHLHIPGRINLAHALRNTDRWWRNWTSQCTYKGPWKDLLKRSLITIKALTYQPTGGIVAAVTTSLPEQLGGERNWDYRFCWLRDATFTLLALMNAGFKDSARDWRRWLSRAIAGNPAQFQVMYGVAGERDLTEREIPWLPGYEGAKPVRIGNAAVDQLQLDIYGEIADVLHHARKNLESLPREAEIESAALEHLEKIWREPDEGIWEVRGPRQHFTHSKVLAWVAFDRAIKDARRLKRKAPIDRWKVVRQEIHEEVCERGFDRDLNSFVQYFGSKEVDGALLLLPLVGFLPPSDPRIAGTVRQIENKLMRDHFVLRYDTEAIDDGLQSGEGAFLPCSFWLVDNYVLLGRETEAQALLERLLGLVNDVGLLAEEYDPQNSRFLGNFPQAFSHVALVNSILRFSRKGKRLREKS